MDEEPPLGQRIARISRYLEAADSMLPYLNEQDPKLVNTAVRGLRQVYDFYRDKKTFKREANYVAMVNNDYNYLKGLIQSAKGSIIKEEDYLFELLDNLENREGVSLKKSPG